MGVSLSFRVAGLALFSAVVACGSQPRPSIFEYADKPEGRPLTPDFRRGMNLGNAFDAPSIGAWGVTVNEAHFRYVAEAGFDHIRLPVRFNARAEPHPPYALDPTFLENIDWAVEQAHRYGLAIILDLHHYTELMEDPHGHADRMVAIWKQLAEHYASQPATVAFEVLNEPAHALEPELLNELMARAIAEIRKTNPTRTIIVNCYHWANAKYLAQLELPDDPNVVGSFHMYEPFLFTHQGAQWGDPWVQTRGVVFPGPPPAPLTPVKAAQKEDWVVEWFERYNHEPPQTNPSGISAIDGEFRYAEEFMARTGHAVYMGEFAAIDHADRQSRENWLRVVRNEAEARGIGWAYWDDGASMMALDVASGTWLEEIERAIVPAAQTTTSP